MHLSVKKMLQILGISFSIMVIGFASYKSDLVVKKQLKNKDDSYSLRISPRLTIKEFIELNRGAPVFQSPIHPVAGRFISLSPLSGVELQGKNRTESIFFSGIRNNGAAIVHFKPSTPDAASINEVFVDYVSFRPYSSRNSVEVTQKMLKQFFQAMGGDDGCKLTSTKGDQFGKSIIANNGNNLSITLKEMTDIYPKRNLRLSATYECKGITVTLSVIEPREVRSERYRSNNPSSVIHEFDVTYILR